jgi:beta-mannosidase
MMHYGDLVVRYLARGIVKDLCPDLSYTSSSPYSLSDVGNDPPSGDTHGGCWEHAYKDDMARFRHHVHQKEHVFSSEFGAPGPCQMRSIRKFIPEDKLWPLNEMWEAHVQDNPYNDLKETFVQVQEAAGTRLFHAPQSAAEFVKVGGTWNSELLAYEMEFHRRRFPEEAGGMIWMMNDCWPCASWSLIDYYGLQKQVYYALRRVCAPVTISIAEAGDTYEVHVVNTPLKALQGELEVALHTLEGDTKTVAKAKVRVEPQGAASLLNIPRKAVDTAPGHYLHATFTTPAFTVSKIFFHKLWKGLPWPDPGLTVRAGKCVPKGGEYAATITIKAKHFARCVNLTTGEDIPAYYSDNYFDMVPGETRKITVQALQPFEPDKILVRHWLDAWD